MSGVKLADLLEETATAEVNVGGKVVHLVYRVLWDARISAEDWERFKALPVREYWAELLARLLTSWDLVDEDEQPLPIEKDAIVGSPMPNRLLQGFADAITGSALSGKASSNGLHAT